MGKKYKTAFPNDLWVLEYVDRMDRDGGHVTEPHTREAAEALYADITENGTRATSKDKNALGYYVLRPLG